MGAVGRGPVGSQGMSGVEPGVGVAGFGGVGYVMLAFLGLGHWLVAWLHWLVTRFLGCVTRLHGCIRFRGERIGFCCHSVPIG